ncbi:MAG: immunoglobulin domain-containing protein [Opitutaceae bacterium]|nr:immunoglobulin domain-containing protein [Opitutaceae bacterium]
MNRIHTAPVQLLQRPRSALRRLAAAAAGVVLSVSAVAQVGVLTPAGGAGVTGSTDNADGTLARFNEPQGLASDGTSIYIADTLNNRIRKMNISTGAVTTLVSSGLNNPSGVAVDGAGNVYVADWGSHVVRIYNSGGTLTTTVGISGTSGNTDSTLALSTFSNPIGVAVIGSGASAIVYVADTGNNRIRRIDVAGLAVTSIVTTGLSNPWSITTVGNDTTGDIYFTDAGNGVVKRVSRPTNTVTTLNGSYSLPRGIASDGTDLYIAQAGAQVISKIATPLVSGGTVTSVLVGSSGNTGSANGISGGSARFFGPYGLVATSANTLLVADSKNHTIRRVFPVTAPTINSANNTSFPLNSPGTFSVTATGTPAPTFSIQSGTPPTGVTLASNGVLSGTPTQSGTFNLTIRATNVVGGDTVGTNDQAFTLTVTGSAAAQIVTHPVSAARDVGQNATFTGSATGAPAPTLKWQRQAAGNVGFFDLFESPPYSGVATGTLTVTSVTGSMNGDQFRLVASNSSGPDAISNVATLSINNTAPVFSLHPANTTIIPGGNGSLTATVIGSPSPTLRWQRQIAGGGTFNDIFDDAIFGGTGTTTLTITGALVSMNNDQFRLVASNVNGTTASNPAVLSVTAVLPAITLQPTAAIVNLGANATFSSGASGNPTPTLRWQRQPSGTSGFIDLFDDGTYSGTTSATLTVVAVSSGMSGDQFRLNATNAGGSVQSTPALLTVNLGTTISTFAGVGGQGGSVDGTGALARFSSPSSIVIDSSGNFYIADTGSHVIRKMTAAGAVTTIAGLAGVPGSVDGPVATARFNAPAGIAIDPAGNIYVADSFNHTIRTISPSGVVATLAGSPGISSPASDGVGSLARFNVPTGVAVDSVGTVYVADSFNHAIRRITAGGTVSTFAGALGSAGLLNGVGVNSRFNTPNSLVVDSGGNVIVADSGNNVIRRITSGGTVTTVAGSAIGLSGSVDGNGTAAMFFRPAGVAVDSAGNIFVADTVNSIIRRIATNGDVTTVAGTAGNSGYLDGVGTAVRFNRPYSLVLDANSNLYIADTSNHVIRRTGSTAAPTIVTHPADRTVAVGQNTTYTVLATGTPTPTGYQWQRKPAGSFDFTSLVTDATYTGVNTASLTVNNVNQLMSGDEFRVVVSNGVLPAATSNAAKLTVGVAPVFTSVAEASFRALQANTFTVVTTSATTVTYSATGLPSWATLNASTGVLSGNPPDTTGTPVAITITANNGLTATQAFTLTLLPPNLPPTISSQPAGLALDPGATANFSVAVTGTAPFTYQWRRNGTAIPGATASSISLSGVQASSSGVYSVVVTNAFGTVTSTGAALVINSAPSITVQPQAQVVLGGGSASFSVVASGSGTLAYQWRRNGTPIAGANSATFQIAAVGATDVGSYDVQVTNPVATVQSSAALLTLATAPAAPQITLNPVGRTVVIGGSATLYAAATGAPAPAFQWRKNGSAIPGANGPTLSFSNVQVGDAANYDVVATNSAGSATSGPAGLTVIARSYAGVYFGTYSGGIGSWALYLRDDNTGVFLSYLSGSSAPIMSLNVVLDGNGQFTFSQSAIAEVGGPGEPPRAAALLAVTLTATVGADGTVTGNVAGGASATMSGGIAPVTGGTAGVAGYYQAGSGANGVVVHTIAGPNGVAYAVGQAGAAFDGGAGTVTSGGALTVSTGRSVITENISADAGLVSGSSSGFIAATSLSGGSDSALARQRLLNISSRARVGAGDAVAIAGFVIAGQEAKPVLIRAVGPTLGAAPFNVPGALATPRLELFRSGNNTAFLTNSGIAGNRAVIDAAGVQAGAFALGAAGADAAIVTTLAPGAYTAVVSSTTTTAGVALVEVYDLSGANPGQKLLNISTRAGAGTAENQLIAGFVIPAGTAKRVLVRGVGPGLAAFGLTGTLAQPVLTLSSGGTTVATNTNWSTSADSATIRDASAQVGAFPLVTNDSAVIVTLPPGNYTAQVTGVNSTTGLALIEVYELP